ncbi:MAG: hypothetical protein CFH19_00449 [Alphaproteobacteria bacterium MarineAlpha5_Bin9]|nr:MAG: hypothetical protein CFH19_00449 [Alphaproteobacteria bacterium MarineAlpha5_Bin9]|tara:strand:+ start:23758 stop:24099 length:342 start_codon:yes stop_codon:yes gene_type:complete
MEAMPQLFMFILIFFVFYIFLIRPQLNRAKQHRDMVNNLKRGDKIVTKGGIIGEINKIRDNKEIQLQISDNVEIKLFPGMIEGLYNLDNIEKKEPIKDDNKNKSFLSNLFQKK